LKGAPVPRAVELAPVAAAFVLVFLAELGDKTQLALVAMAARARPWAVWAGAVAGFAAATLAAVLAGSLVARLLPRRLVLAASGLLFLAFAALAWRSRDRAPVAAGRAGLGAAFLAVVVGELGDKSQLATAALAAGTDPVAAALGALAALAASAALAALAGHALARRLRPRPLAAASGALFALSGAALLVAAARA
jgi:Ca2+/H+ antiporter, TMEM165/GDT1 family